MSPAAVELEEVRRIARLARLGLAEEELERLATEMGAIMGHFREIREAGVGGGFSGIQERGLPPRLRADVPGSDPLLRTPAELAPEWADGFFLVPRLPGLEDEPVEGKGRRGAKP